MKYTETGTDFDHSVAYTYDNLNNLTGLKETINGSTLTTTYTYDDDNRVTKVENSNNNARTYTYDGFGRLAQRTTSYGDTAVLTEDFTFSQTNIESQKYSFGLRSVTQYYEYDDNGNIVTFSEAAGLERGEEGFCTTYVYDSQNQLIRENNVDAQKTWVWTYDNAGNITSRSEYAYTFGELGEPLDTVVYGYTNADWGDLLTSYDGKPITYDQIGNPLRIGSCRYSWEHGRQLASMFDGQNTAWHFTYDASGMRTSRSNGTTTYSYVYNGGLLMKMTVSNVVLEFAYDASGAPMTITLNGSRYYYLTNIQGDVVSIVDGDGTLVVHYVYDAWGNIITTSGTLADRLGVINPLRYRGYVYDQETELYYLQSRYYNPEIGRFLNADAYTSTGQGFVGYNMFAYCLNNPVNGCDPCGTCFHQWNFWDDCDACGGETFGKKVAGYVERINSIYSQQQALDTQIRMQQIEMGKDAAEALWNAHVHSVELEIQAQYQQDMAVINTAKYFRDNPLVAVDLATGVVGLSRTIVGIGVSAGIISIPVVGQIVLGVVGAACSVWGICRVIETCLDGLQGGKT